MAGESEVKVKTCPVNLYQNPRELEQLLARVRALQPKRILEVGSLYGGTLWHWMQNFPGALVVSVDMIAQGVPEHPREKIMEARQLWQSWVDETQCLLTWYVSPSDYPPLLKLVDTHGPFDFIFVDAGHKYSEVAADFTNYWPMLRAGGLMAFHDIGYPNHYASIGVGTWWRDQQATGRWQMTEFIEVPGEWGIGVIQK
jgi:predicted O-methyltransferase YrrM